MTYQGHYLAYILSIIQEVLVNTICTRYMVQSRVKKSILDKSNGKGSIGKCVDKCKQGTENVKQILDHQADQWALHCKHEPICVQS